MEMNHRKEGQAVLEHAIARRLSVSETVAADGQGYHVP